MMLIDDAFVIIEKYSIYLRCYKESIFSLDETKNELQKAFLETGKEHEIITLSDYFDMHRSL